MAKRVFFSFHYQDVIDFRANVVRNHWMTKPDRESAGFFDASIWEKTKKESDLALKKLINKGLDNTSTTAVLIGSETYQRRWVRYEIIKSIATGNKIIAIHINSIKGKDQKIKSKGINPLDYLGYIFSDDGMKISFYEYKNSKWVTYGDFDGYSMKNAQPQLQRGKLHKLSNMYKTYDWVVDDGFTNFATWVK